MGNPCLWVVFELFFLMFPKLWDVYACFVVFGLQGLSPWDLGCAWIESRVRSL